MKGLELSRLFWSKVGFPSFSRIFPDRLSDIVVGMVGPGSECYGFDDTYSQDHDWGPGFCVWMNDAEDRAFKVQLQAWYDSLPKIFEGFVRSNVLEGEDHRVGVDSVFHFYERYTGLNHIPCTEREWSYLSTSSLSVCTNGLVFHDPQGTFTAWRKALLAFYPESIRERLLAKYCRSASQSGQYNFHRSLLREDAYTATYCAIKYCADCISIIYLLNKRYEPFYKWGYRGLIDLPRLGQSSMSLITSLLKIPSSCEGSAAYEATIETLAVAIVEELARQNLINDVDPYLWNCGEAILQKQKEGFYG